MYSSACWNGQKWKWPSPETRLRRQKSRRLAFRESFSFYFTIFLTLLEWTFVNNRRFRVKYIFKQISFLQINHNPNRFISHTFRILGNRSINFTFPYQFACLRQSVKCCQTDVLMRSDILQSFHHTDTIEFTCSDKRCDFWVLFEQRVNCPSCTDFGNIRLFCCSDLDS